MDERRSGLRLNEANSPMSVRTIDHHLRHNPDKRIMTSRLLKPAINRHFRRMTSRSLPLTFFAYTGSCHWQRDGCNMLLCGIVGSSVSARMQKPWLSYRCQGFFNSLRCVFEAIVPVGVLVLDHPHQRLVHNCTEHVMHVEARVRARPSPLRSPKRIQTPRHKDPAPIQFHRESCCNTQADSQDQDHQLSEHRHRS